MFERWLTYSIRRRLLDAHLEVQGARMGGCVLEVGNGREGRRGRFRPPVEQAQRWVLLDVRPTVQPDVCGDVQQLSFKDASVDTVLCLETMEYVRQPEAALREIRRVLRPGGVFILATPFLHRLDSPQDYWRFTEPALRQLLRDAGFLVESCEAQGAALAVVVNILQHAIAAIPNRRWRMPLAVAAYLPLQGLLWLDAPLARRLPTLRTFSTGFVIVGRVVSSPPIEVSGACAT